MSLAKSLELLLVLLDGLAEPLLHLEAVRRDGGELLRSHVILNEYHQIVVRTTEHR